MKLIQQNKLPLTLHPPGEIHCCYDLTPVEQLTRISSYHSSPKTSRRFHLFWKVDSYFISLCRINILFSNLLFIVFLTFPKPAIEILIKRFLVENLRFDQSKLVHDDFINPLLRLGLPINRKSYVLPEIN